MQPPKPDGIPENAASSDPGTGSRPEAAVQPPTQTIRQLRALAARLQTLLEAQKQRFARQVHDDLGQKLTILAIELTLLAEDATRGEAGLTAQDLAAKIRELAGLANGLVESAQQISLELYPKVLEEFGLIAALEWQSQQFQRRTGMRAAFHAGAEELILDPGVATEIFRLVQEILSNVARHAKASRVEIRLEREGDRLRLHVRDNGRGITPQELESENSLGILAMRERVVGLSGEFRITGASNRGTTVTVSLPLIPPVKAEQPS